MTGDSPRRLTHEQARIEQLLYWRSKTMPERLSAAASMTKRMYAMRGIDIDERKTDFTPRRVPRSTR
jgi:hypothetical protein